MMKYKLINKKTSKEVGVYNSLADAEKEVVKQCFGNKEISIFNYEVEEIEEKQEPNELIPTFADARKFLTEQYLEIPAYKKEEETSTLLKEINPKHAKALIAFNRLCTIAQAWNKIDGFVVDWEDTSQCKYFPWFLYSNDAAGFVCVDTYNATTYAIADIGSRLCFMTRERAKQFGEQFIDLWNDFLR